MTGYCPECGKYYKTESWLRRHLKNKHDYTKSEIENAIEHPTCYKCGKKLLHKDIVGCTYCGAWHGKPYILEVYDERKKKD